MSEIISILAISAAIFGLGVLAGLCWSLVIIDRREPPPNPYDEFTAPDYPPPSPRKSYAERHAESIKELFGPWKGGGA